ncbi:MCE family protein [Amycolatopsis sp. NPDC059027]|uniref:MCE family protein n=1 Tax=Amycolatopsis sp. NPDC059027 TaxID=3346709 RepID=UPI00366D7F0A
MRGMAGPVLKLAIFVAVTALCTGVLAVTLANTSFSPENSYVAQFSDVLGLNPGDDVRMSGVKVGSVTSVEPKDPKYAEVRFKVDRSRPLSAETRAALRYRNLIGQRYIALDSDVPGPGAELRPGGTIPVAHTTPALDMTALFNGFRPLFRALKPEDVNQLSGEIIQVLQGEGGTIENLLSHTASLSSTLADRDKVVGSVIDNLNAVLSTVNAHSGQLTSLVDQTQQLVSGLAAQRKPIGDAITGMGDLADSTAGLLDKSRVPLKDSIAGLQSLGKSLNDSQPVVEKFLQTLPGKLEKMTGLVDYGSWLNFYLCNLEGTVGLGSLNVTVPILPLPATSTSPRCKP